jgi:hypothetical protein
MRQLARNKRKPTAKMHTPARPMAKMLTVKTIKKATRRATRKMLMALPAHMLFIGTTKAPWAQKTGAKNFPHAAKANHKHL